MIYLDHHAGTPLSPAARVAMLEALDVYGNPSSAHAAGRFARARLEDARRRIAEGVGARAVDVVLVSGGTEACQAGVLGLAGTRAIARVVTTEIEHPAVSGAVDALAARGLDVVRLPVRATTSRSEWLDALDRALTGRAPALLALQWVNHETGTILPVRESLELTRRAGGSSFLDASHALGRVPIAFDALGCDALAIAASKVGGPKGAGALVLRRDADVEALVGGGPQERGRRGGTPDLVAHVGFGAACAELPARLASMPRLAALRDRLEADLVGRGAEVNGALPLGVDEWPSGRVPTVSDVSFAGIRGDELVAALDLEGVCVSRAAACSSGVSAPSRVVAAMYPVSPERAEAAIRVSFGPENDERDVDGAIAAFRRVLARFGA